MRTGIVVAVSAAERSRSEATAANRGYPQMELAARCILAGSPPGSWVLDFCAGSGTTGVGAVQHGRITALIESDERQAATSRKRLGDRLTEEGPARGAAARPAEKAR